MKKSKLIGACVLVGGAALLGKMSLDMPSNKVTESYMLFAQNPGEDEVIRKYLVAMRNPINDKIDVVDVKQVICAQKGCSFEEMTKHTEGEHVKIHEAIDAVNGSLESHGQRLRIPTPQQIDDMQSQLDVKKRLKEKEYARKKEYQKQVELYYGK